jgi:PAS domain-containing protein
MMSSILTIAYLPLAAVIGLPIAAVVRARSVKRKTPAHELLMEKLPDGVIVLDGKNRIRKINAAMRTLMGAPRGDFSEPMEDVEVDTEALKHLDEPENLN